MKPCWLQSICKPVLDNNLKERFSKERPCLIISNQKNLKNKIKPLNVIVIFNISLFSFLILIKLDRFNCLTIRFSLQLIEFLNSCNFYNFKVFNESLKKKLGSFSCRLNLFSKKKSSLDGTWTMKPNNILKKSF